MLLVVTVVIIRLASDEVKKGNVILFESPIGFRLFNVSLESCCEEFSYEDLYQLHKYLQDISESTGSMKMKIAFPKRFEIALKRI